jgi:hypothetical protein
MLYWKWGAQIAAYDHEIATKTKNRLKRCRESSSIENFKKEQG